MPRLPTQPDSDGNSEETGEPVSRRRNKAQPDGYLPYPGHAGALLPGLLQQMHDETSLSTEGMKPTDLDRGRKADMARLRNALAKLGRAAAALFRPLGIRFLFWLDRVLTDPAERRDPPPSPQ